MESRAVFWSGIVVLVGLLALVAGFRQRTTHVLGRGHVAWTLNYGNGLSDVGRERALDGRDYGPLAFAVAGRGADATLFVADTYHERILEVTAGKPPRAYPTPGAFLEEMAVGPGGVVYAADNHRHRILRLDHGRTVPVYTLPGGDRMTRVVWRMAATPTGDLLVDWIAVGEGQIRAYLDRIDPRGVRVLARGVIRGGVEPFRGEGMVRSVAVQSDGTIYTEPLATSAGGQRIEKMSPDGAPAAAVNLSASTGGAVLVGVDNRGDLYLVARTDGRPRGGHKNSGGRGSQELWVFDREGRLLARVSPPQGPDATWPPVVVTARGTVYWADAGRARWRIIRYRWRARKRWVWRLPLV